MRRARSFVRRIVAKMGPVEAKRIILDAVTIPAQTSSVYDNPKTIGLIKASAADVDEEAESNATTVAEVPPYSKVVGMKFNFQIYTGSMSAGDRIRWMLVKDIDDEGGISSLADATFHSSDDTQAARELRSRTLAKGFMVVSDRTAKPLSIFVKRKTLARLGTLRDNDRFELILAGASSAAASINGFGTIYARLK